MRVRAEKFKEKTFRQILIDQSSPLHQNICGAEADVSISLRITRILMEKFSENKAFLVL